MIRTSMLAVAAIVAVGGGAAGCGGDRPASPTTAPSATTGLATESQGPVLFTEAPSTPQAAPASATDLVGKQYGYITAVNVRERAITFDKVDWFTGAAAAKACAADGVSAGDGAECHDYYVRNRNTKVRTAQLSPDAKLSLQSPNDSMVQLEITLAQLAGKYHDRLFIITFTGGAASRVSEQFLP